MRSKPDFKAIIARSRGVAEGMSKGVQFLFRKNNIDLISGIGEIGGNNRVEVKGADGEKRTLTAKNIIVATGARSRELSGIPQDGKKIIGYREAMTLDRQPGSMVVIGSGAIGSEFACFYQSLGTDVTLVEFLPRIVPNEDEEISKQLERSFKKLKMRVLTDSAVESADTSGEKCRVKIKTPKGYEEIEADIVFSAVGITTNTRRDWT